MSDVESPPETHKSPNATNQETKDTLPSYEQPMRNCKRIWIILGGFVAVAAIVIVAVLLSSRDDKDGHSNKNGTNSTADHPTDAKDPVIKTAPDYSALLMAQGLNRTASAEQVRAGLQILLDAYLEESNPCQGGMVLGVTRASMVGSTTERIFVGGSAMHELEIDEDSLWEIGSISKPLTSLLLAREHVLNNVDLDALLNDFLPNDIAPLQVRYRQSAFSPENITLWHLATHSSGFPRLTQSIMRRALNPFFNPETQNPYDGYTEGDLIAEIRRLGNTSNSFVMPSPSAFEYSNFGYSVLAFVLEQITQQPFETLQTEFVSNSLGMESTFVAKIPTSSTDRLVPGLRPNGLPAYYWYDGGIMINGAGSTVSSAKDLMTWIEAILEANSGSETRTNETAAPEAVNVLTSALQLSTIPQTRFDDVPVGLALGWFYVVPESAEHIWYNHGGGTAGFSTFVTYQPISQTGIVALSNCGEILDADEIGSALAEVLFEFGGASGNNTDGGVQD